METNATELQEDDFKKSVLNLKKELFSKFSISRPEKH